MHSRCFVLPRDTLFLPLGMSHRKLVDFFCAVDPIGTKVPTLGKEEVVRVPTRASGADVVLLCETQAFPIPSYR